MLQDVVWLWAAAVILAVLWVLFGAMSDWAHDLNVTLAGALAYRCAVLWNVIQRICGIKRR